MKTKTRSKKGRSSKQFAINYFLLNMIFQRHTEIPLSGNRLLTLSISRTMSLRWKTFRKPGWLQGRKPRRQRRPILALLFVRVRWPQLFIFTLILLVGGLFSDYSDDESEERSVKQESGYE